MVSGGKGVGVAVGVAVGMVVAVGGLVAGGTAVAEGKGVVVGAAVVIATVVGTRVGSGAGADWQATINPSRQSQKLVFLNPCKTNIRCYEKVLRHG